MVTNSREYQKLYMQKYIKEKGGELYKCECSKDVKKYDKARHNKTKYHLEHVNKIHTKSDIEELKAELESIKKKLKLKT